MKTPNQNGKKNDVNSRYDNIIIGKVRHYPSPEIIRLTEGKEGWKCPNCKKVNAPWRPCCECNPNQDNRANHGAVAE